MNRKVSIIIPTIRPGNVPQLERWIIERAGVPKEDLEILFMEDEKRIGAPKMVKALVQMASHNLIMYLGDDCEPQANFVLAALNTMKKFEGNWGLVGLNCGRWGGIYCDQWQPFLDHGEVAQHWLAHKKLLKHLEGEFFHTGYVHCYSDNELTQRCKQIKRYRFAEKAKIIHNHPIVMKDESLWNDDLRRVYSNDIYQADRQLFEKRRANKWKTPAGRTGDRKEVLIVVPLHGEGFHRFWTCVSRLQFRSLNAGIDTILQKKSSAVITHCRNKLVSDNLRRFPHASHFLFLDADMTFPDDLLIKLMAHDKDIVTVNAYRKASPYYPVVSMQGADDDYFKPIHIKPSEGKLRAVTSGGTGIVLIKRKVFETMNFPWFTTEYIEPFCEDAESQDLIEGKLFVSEDNRFFVVGSALGFKLYCDFSIEIGHLGIYEFTWRDHEEYIKKHPEIFEELKENGERNQIDHEDADPGNSRICDRQYDQPGVS